MTVKIGDRAVYRPRVPYGRQSELFCFVTRVVDAEKGIVDLVAFPAGGEFQHINNVSPKGEVIQIHCWEPYVGSLEARIADLEALIAQPRIIAPAGLADFAEEYNRSPGGITMVEEPKRGPGRPRKDAAA